MSNYPSFIDRVEAQIRITETGCHEFTGPKDYKGYGRMRDRGRKVFVHRRYYELKKGVELPSDRYICHTCDNRCCVNLDHLYVGTHLQNMLDMKSRGRRAAFNGENNGKSKLTDVAVVSAREEYATTSCTQAYLAEKYGVSKSVMNKVLNNKCWKHVKEVDNAQ